MAQIDLKNATIKFKDGGTEELEIKIGEGNLSWTEKVNRIYTKDRGLLNDVRDGDEEPVEVSFDFIWEFLRSDTGNPPSPVDVMYHQNEASEWVSTDEDECRPFAFDIEVLYEPPCGGESAEKILLEDFRHEQLQYDLRNASIAASGKCNITKATITREA
jgi:hypothetical protein